MNHELVAAHNMTERYLLNELDPAVRDEFEEHYFNCPECAVDVHAASVLVERIKDGAIPNPELEEDAAPPMPVPAAWLAWFRPAFAVPVMAVLLAVIGYQNLVTYPQLARQLDSPQVLPWAPVNLNTYGSDGPTVSARAGQSFLLLVRIPANEQYSKYTAELYNPAGKVEWSFGFAIPAGSTQDHWPVQVPGANREAGRYELKVKGITATGESKDVGDTSFELRIEK
jgi:hypothetical protein